MFKRVVTTDTPRHCDCELGQFWTTAEHGNMILNLKANRWQCRLAKDRHPLLQNIYLDNVLKVKMVFVSEPKLYYIFKNKFQEKSCMLYFTLSTIRFVYTWCLRKSAFRSVFFKANIQIYIYTHLSPTWCLLFLSLSLMAFIAWRHHCAPILSTVYTLDKQNSVTNQNSTTQTS